MTGEFEYRFERKLIGGVVWVFKGDFSDTDSPKVRIRYFSGIFLKLWVRRAKRIIRRVERACS